MARRSTELVLDARDPASPGRFWAEVLGYGIVDSRVEPGGA